MAKRDSIAGAVETFTNAAKVIKPTRTLKGNAKQHFARLWPCRPVQTINDADRELFTQLAEVMALINDAQADIAEHGLTCASAQGGLIENPSVKALAKLVAIRNSTATLLGLSAAARGISGGNAAARNAGRVADEQAAREALGAIGDDGTV